MIREGPKEGLVVLELQAFKIEGHYAEKCQLWLEEALKEYASVTLLCYGQPSVAMPAAVRIISLGSASVLHGNFVFTRKLRAYLYSFLAGLKTSRLAHKTNSDCLFLSSTPLPMLLAAVRLGKPSKSAQIIMALGKGGNLPLWCRALFRKCAQSTLMVCNTNKTKEALTALGGEPYNIIYVPDPIGEPSQGRPVDPRIISIFIPGDDDSRRSSIERLSECKNDWEATRFSLHHPGLKPSREIEIQTAIPASWSFFGNFAADRREFCDRFMASDAVLICYRNQINYASGNLVQALFCRRPLLVSRFGASEELAERFGRIGEFFEENDSASLSTALLRLKSWTDQEWGEFEEAVQRVINQHGARMVCKSLFLTLKNKI